MAANLMNIMTSKASAVTDSAGVAIDATASAVRIAGEITALGSIVGAETVVLLTEYLEPRWYAAYTKANHEKRVREQLEHRSIESFLPLYESVRRWKDRRVRLAMPLFPGYIFVRLAFRDRISVLQVPGVAKLVGFNGTPAALPEDEIEALRKGLRCGVRAEPHPYLIVGKRVRVKSGPLAGLTGILMRKKNRARFIISVDLIMRSVAIEVEALELEPEW
jgi:transcription antitermination factor NusG